MHIVVPRTSSSSPRSYAVRTRVDFGTDIDLTGTVVDLTLRTDEFPLD
ncbi:hypothetical protein [Streptomyces shenzhenensis]|nr:hypothetical protein [Streptomyces shenzhenensis]